MQLATDQRLLHMHGVLNSSSACVQQQRYADRKARKAFRRGRRRSRKLRATVRNWVAAHVPWQRRQSRRETDIERDAHRTSSHKSAGWQQAADPHPDVTQEGDLNGVPARLADAARTLEDALAVDLRHAARAAAVRDAELARCTCAASVAAAQLACVLRELDHALHASSDGK